MHSTTQSNAFAERFVLSIKSECLDRMVLFGEGHLRTAVREYVAHYQAERPHQGLENELIDRVESGELGAPSDAPVERRERLGGMLSFYHRQAA